MFLEKNIIIPYLLVIVDWFSFKLFQSLLYIIHGIKSQGANVMLFWLDFYYHRFHPRQYNNGLGCFLLLYCCDSMHFGMGLLLFYVWLCLLVSVFKICYWLHSRNMLIFLYTYYMYWSIHHIRNTLKYLRDFVFIVFSILYAYNLDDFIVWNKYGCLSTLLELWTLPVFRW